MPTNAFVPLEGGKGFRKKKIASRYAAKAEKTRARSKASGQQKQSDRDQSISGQRFRMGATHTKRKPMKL